MSTAEHAEQVLASAVVVGPNDHLIIGVPWDATDQAVEELAQRLLTLQPELAERIVVVAAERFAVVQHVGAAAKQPPA